MNLDKLMVISAGIVATLLLSMYLQELQVLIWRAQAKIIYESRTETWGSPRFFFRNSDKLVTKIKKKKE
jgi:hypothetical protein